MLSWRTVSFSLPINQYDITYTIMKTSRIATLLRLHRAMTGQDQDELALEIGISQPTLSQVESGRPLAKSTAQKIYGWMFTEAK